MIRTQGFNIFGSEDSIDFDVMYFLDEIPSVAECKQFEAELVQTFPIKDKKANVNFAVVRDGVIVDVYKGTPDECNNCILHTYHLHAKFQCFNLRIINPLKRNIELKLARSLRIILSFMSRTQFREKIKEALKGTTQQKMDLLKEIKFEEIKDLNKNNHDLIEFYKHVAFQIGQCLGLIVGLEYYTKKSIYNDWEIFENFLTRKPDNPVILTNYTRFFLKSIRERYEDVEILQEKPLNMTWSEFNTCS